MRPIVFLITGLIGTSCILSACNKSLVKELAKQLGEDASAQPVASGSSASPTGTVGTSLTLRSLAKTGNSRIKTARDEVIRDKSRYQELWQEHAGTESSPPPVDFSKEMALAVFMGQKKSGGYSVTIDKALQSGQNLTVHVTEKSPAPDTFVTQVLTAPAHWVSLSKVSGQVTFQRGQTTLPSPQPTPSATERNSTMRPLAKTANSQIRELRQTVVRDQTTWKNLWQEHTGSDADLPTVNFEEDMVLALFMGEKPTGGYSLAIQEMLTEGNGLKVIYQEIKPAADAMVIQVLTAPALMVAVPKMSGAVRFVAQP